jgi:dolichol-phosphate mannosyltransferase
MARVYLAQIPAIKIVEAPRSSAGMDACPQPLLSIVICTLDEHEAIRGVLSELGEHLQGVPHEIIVVDDSRDERTGDAVNAYASGDPRIRLVRRYNASGLSSAAITGWDVAKGRYLAIMDGDGQHDPTLMKGLLDQLANKDVDIAVASRYLNDSRSGLGGVRHTLSRSGIWLTDTALGVPLADPLSGCFAMTRDWYSQVRSQLSGLGFKILIDVVASGQRRPRTAQIPTLLRTRAGGTSKLDSRVIIDLVTLLIEKRTRGRFKAGKVMQGVALGATLVAQWLAAGVLLALTCPLWITMLLSVGVGLAARLWVNHLMTSRSLRPRTLHDAMRQWAAFYASRWSDVPLNAGLSIALCAVHCPWPLAVMVGVGVAELRYHIGRHAGVVA